MYTKKGRKGIGILAKYSFGEKVEVGFQGGWRVVEEDCERKQRRSAGKSNK